MLKRSLALAAAVLLLGAAPSSNPAPMNSNAAVKPPDTQKPIAELTKKYPEQKARIERGVKQAASLWRPEDGDFAAFAVENYVADEKQRDALFNRFETQFEQLDGLFNELGRELRFPTDVDVGPMLPVDPLFAAMDPSSHLTEDLFKSKIAFVVLLNFPLTTLKERQEHQKDYSRREWAEVRLAGRFSRRVPPEIQAKQTEAGADADLYIAQYNIWMHHVLNAKGERPWPKDLRLISHWNLRDELKANYALKEKGLEKQRLILAIMDRIVTQTIPAAVIDNPRVDWDPVTNKVTPAPEAEIEKDAPVKTAVTGNEPDVRYAKWMAQFKAAKAADPYSPIAPTAILRSFELQREIPEERVVALLKSVLESPLVPKVAAKIQANVGRPLEPSDLWYPGFKPSGGKPESELDAITKKKYPTPEAFAKDIPNILVKLGFSKDKAQFVASKIKVDPSRGAGHAMQAMRRGDFPHLRTRVGKDGMDYKGYNIAVHELGHNVEQVFSLYEVDHTLLQSVPNNAFTEALAFVFQARDLELLGLSKPSAEAEKMRVLNDFWSTWEIAGVALVDIGAWHWLYDHPDATPAQFREAVVKLSREVWNKYYAPVLGQKDATILGIYSHTIAYPLYVTDYPLGHMISFQIEGAMKKGGKLGAEFERMAKFGSVTPDAWMINASGMPVSAEPLLKATEEAVK